MLEAGRQRLNLQTVCDGGLFALLPADDRRKMHRREQILLKRGQVRIWPDLTCGIKQLGRLLRMAGDSRRHHGLARVSAVAQARATRRRLPASALVMSDNSHAVAVDH